MTSVATVGSRQASRFNPANLGGLALWLDSADSATFTFSSGSNISQWNDKSGNGWNLTVSAGTPVLSNNALNGLSSVYLNGSSSLNNASFPFTSNANLSLFVVANVNSNTNTQYNRLINGGGTVSDQYLFVGTVMNSNIGTFVGNGAGWNDLNSNSPSVSIQAQWHIVEMIINSNVLTPYYNGNAQSIKNGAMGSVNGLCIGGQFSIQNWPGFCAELLIFRDALTSLQRQQVEGYLAWKWGLTSNLPSTHFARRLPPFSRTAWSPLDAGDCVLWLDSTDMSGTPTNGATVSNWFDKSGLSNHYTGGDASITYQTNILNSLPAIRFTAGGRLSESTPVDFPVGNSSAFESTTFFVASASNTNTGGIMVFGPVAGGQAKVYYTSGGTVNSTMFGGVAGISNAITTGTAFVFSDTYRFTSTSNTSHTGWLNGSNVGVATGSTVNLSNTPNYIGHTGFGSEFFSGNIHEILHYRGVLPETNRILVEAYLAQKWGLTSNLPSGHLARLSRPLAPYFTPLAVQGCTVWLDAADSNSLTLSGSNVTQWNDKSGNGYNAVSVNTSYPIYQSNVLNSRGILGFNLTNDVLVVSNDFTTGRFPCLAYFAVVRPLSPSSQANGGILSTDTAGSYGRTLAMGSGSWQQEYHNGFTNITPYSSNTWAIVSLHFVSTVSSLFTLNGQTYSATTSGTGGNTATLKIGSYNDSGNYGDFNGNFDIAEILVYTNPLSATARQKVEGYLAWKWGLQASLPSSHPYSKYAPT